MTTINFTSQIKQYRINLTIERDTYILEIDYSHMADDYHITIFDENENLLSSRQPLVPGYNIIRFDELRLPFLTLGNLSQDTTYKDMSINMKDGYFLLYEDVNQNTKYAFDYT